jgi:hypothetical protein
VLKRYVSRWTATTVAFVVGLAVCAPPALADTRPPLSKQTSLTTLSTASLEILRTESGARAVQASAPSDEAFFKTGRGVAVLALMAAGVAFTVWSVNHDRKPVKSPVR